MSDQQVPPTVVPVTDEDDAALQGGVIVGAVPGQHPRVLKEAVRYAKLLGAPLVVTQVDVNRFIAYPDPEGYIQTAAIDLQAESGAEDLADVERESAEILAGADVEWTTRQLVGDPALAIKALADKIDAKLIVVGTRKRGFGETMREFFSGSVAARLSHRQNRSILIVPIGEPADEDWPIEE